MLIHLIIRDVSVPLIKSTHLWLETGELHMVVGLSGSGNSSLICQNIFIRPTQGLQEVPRHGGHGCTCHSHIIHPTAGVRSHVVVGGPTWRASSSEHLHR